MRLQFGTSAFERARGDLPSLPVINMFAEAAPTEETGIVLQSRPGLDDRAANMGSGPVKALFRADGVLSGGLFGISGGHFYAGATNKGAVTGSGAWSMDGYEDRLFFAGGGPLYSYAGISASSVAFPDNASVTKVLVGASRVIALRADTEKFYWSNVLNEVIGALSFASAESQPDKLRDALFIDDILILFGAKTVEFWPNTGDPDLPFQPLEGRVFEAGIKATGCAVKLGSSYAWVTDSNRVCIADPDGVISNAGLEAKIEASASVSLFTFWIEGNEFLALRLDGDTWAYCTRSRMWSQFSSSGDNWLAQCHADGVFGSSSDGKTLEWADDCSDLGGTLPRVFRAGAPLVSGGVIIGNMLARVNVGGTPYLTGDYADPTIEVRLSKDAGKTWGNWKPRSLGRQGEYRTKVQWAALGRASQPGIMAEFRVTDPVDFRVSDVRINEPFA